MEFAVGKPVMVHSFKYINILFGFLVLFGLYISSLYHFLLFHALAEFFSIIVACGIFIIAWNSRKLLDNHYLLFIGIAYLFVGGLDLIHTLAYKGMGVFHGYDANLPTQLWIAARYVESISLLIAPFYIDRKLNDRMAIGVYSLAMILIFGALFYWDLFPECYIEGVGLTFFKKISEYIISLILLASIALLLKKREKFDGTVLRLVVLSIIVTIFSELTFTFYVSVYGFSNLVGHYFKILSFYLIYKAIVETGLLKPYDLLFRNLKQNEESLREARDELEIRVHERTKDLAEAVRSLKEEVSKRKQAEESLRELNVELEQRVAERTSELQAKNRELENFAYAISHDLRTPLRGMDGYSHLLLENYDKKLDDEGKTFLKNIRLSAGQMNKLIDDLLAYSRLGRRPGRAEQIDLQNLINTLLAERSEEVNQRGIIIKVDIPCEPIPGDSDGLGQALRNLLDNAFKFTRNISQPHIEIGGRDEGESCILWVRDNGIGFDMKFHDQIFDIFQPLHISEEYEGTGIGLAMVRKVMENMGGRVRAESIPGQGATFYLEIPKPTLK